MILKKIFAEFEKIMAAAKNLDLKALKDFGAARQPEANTLSRSAAGPKPERRDLMLRSQLQPQTHFQAQSGHAPLPKRGAMETSIVWNLPADRAQEIYNFALFFLIVGGLITITATMALVWVSGARSRATNEHLAEVFAAGDQAKADAAKANERAAEFLLRAQQASAEREKALIELEQVRKLTAWRRVSADQHEKIVKALKGHPASVTILSAGDDPEAAQFAADLAAALSDAAMTVTATKSFLPIPLKGLGMTMSHAEAASILYMVLRNVGFEVKDLPERDSIMLVVGGRP